MKKKKLVGIVVVFVVLIGVLIFFATADRRAYASAEKAFQNQQFEEALAKYKELGAYNDSKDKAKQCEYELTVDGQYLRAMAEGLMARWDMDDVGEDPDDFKKRCETELGKVESFYDQTFDNKELKEDARTYIDYLREAKEATKYYTIDYNTYATRWSDIYAKRSILLVKFVEEYKLPIREEYQDVIEKLVRDGEAAAEQEEARAMIQKIADQSRLIETRDEWGDLVYHCQMKNTTDMTFEYFYLDIIVSDESGKIIDEGQTDNLTNWQPGQEAEVDAYINNQYDENFTIKGKTIKFVPSYSTGTLYQ